VLAIALVAIGLLVMPDSARAAAILDLTYATPGDTNGLFHYYGRQRNTTTWSNPTNAGGLVSCVTQTPTSGWGNCQSAVDRSLGTDTFHSHPGYHAYNLPAGDSLNPNYYTIRNKNFNDPNHMLRNWKLQGSLVGTAEYAWVDIRSHVNDTCLQSLAQYCGWTLPSGSSYKQFRIVSTGQGSGASEYFSFQEVEIYGALNDATLTTTTTTAAPVTTTTTTAPATTTTTTATTTSTTSPGTVSAEMAEQTETMKLGFGILAFLGSVSLMLKAGR
jgi:hypothetical protein